MTMQAPDPWDTACWYKATPMPNTGTSLSSHCTHGGVIHTYEELFTRAGATDAHAVTIARTRTFLSKHGAWDAWYAAVGPDHTAQRAADMFRCTLEVGPDADDDPRITWDTSVRRQMLLTAGALGPGAIAHASRVVLDTAAQHRASAGAASAASTRMPKYEMRAIAEGAIAGRNAASLQLVGGWACIVLSDGERASAVCAVMKAHSADEVLAVARSVDVPVSGPDLLHKCNADTFRDVYKAALRYGRLDVLERLLEDDTARGQIGEASLVLDMIGHGMYKEVASVTGGRALSALLAEHTVVRVKRVIGRLPRRRVSETLAWTVDVGLVHAHGGAWAADISRSIEKSLPPREAEAAYALLVDKGVLTAPALFEYAVDRMCRPALAAALAQRTLYVTPKRVMQVLTRAYVTPPAGTDTSTSHAFVGVLVDGAPPYVNLGLLQESVIIGLHEPPAPGWHHAVTHVLTEMGDQTNADDSAHAIAAILVAVLAKTCTENPTAPDAVVMAHVRKYVHAAMCGLACLPSAHFQTAVTHVARGSGGIHTDIVTAAGTDMRKHVRNALLLMDRVHRGAASFTKADLERMTDADMKRHVVFAQGHSLKRYGSAWPAYVRHAHA